MPVTNRDIVSANLAIEKLDDELQGLRDAYPKFESMPKSKQDRCAQLDKELGEARETLAELSTQWRQEQRKQGKVVNRLPVAGAEHERNADMYGDDEYGFNKYTRAARGRLLNFENTREGYKRAELAGATFYALAGNAKPEMKRRAIEILTSGEHDTSYLKLDGDGRIVGEGQLGAEIRDLTSAVESLGGVLSPTILEASIFTLMENYGVGPREAEVRPMSAAKMKWPRRGKAITGGWDIETIAGTFDKNMDFSSFELDAKDYFIFAGVPNQLMQDSIAPLGDFIMGQMGWRQAFDWDNALFNGDATASFGNISGLAQQFAALTPDTNAANPGLVTAASGSSTDWSKITDDNLFTLLGTPRLYANNTNNWKFYCTNNFFSRVLLPRRSSGQFGWQATFGDGRMSMEINAQSFMGHEVVIVPGPVMPTSAASAQIVCYFGDLSLSSTIGIRLGAEFMATPLAGQAWFTYSTYLRMVQRGDIVNHDTGLTTYDPSNNHIAGPIAALITAS